MKSRIIFSIVLFFLLFQAFLTYGLVSIFYDGSNDHSERPVNLVQRTDSEEAVIKKILELIELDDYKFHTGDINRNFTEKHMETIENRVIGYLDPDRNPGLLEIIGQNKIMVSEPYKFNAVKNIVKSLKEYVLICLEKKDFEKALSAFNAMVSMVIFSERGNEGAQVLICGMISTSLRIILSEVTNKLIDGAKENLTADRLEKMNQKINKCSECATGFFDVLKGEMNAVKTNFTNYPSGFYKNNFFKALALMLAFKSMDLYYGNAIDQYEEIMNKFMSVKDKPYAEACKKIKDTFADFEIKAKTPYSIFLSRMHPLVMMAVPNLCRAFDQFVATKMRMNAISIRIALLKNSRSGGKTPLSINEVPNLPGLSSGKDKITDLFTGEKLKYSVSQTGEVTIYSCGPDMMDNGGKTDAYNGLSAGFDIKL